MNAQEIIDYIANSEKKTPVKVYVNTTAPVDFGSAKVFGGNNSCLWIILLLIFCGGCGCGDRRWGDRNDRCGCNDSCLWIILLLIFCGGCGC